MDLLLFFKNCFVSVFSGDFIFWILAVFIVFSCFQFCLNLSGRGR